MINHKAWIDAGRPRSSSITIDKMKAKNKYKNYIKKRKKSNIDTISDNLHDSIVDKDQTTLKIRSKKRMFKKLSFSNKRGSR